VFYTYAHYTPQGRLFYIGKGQGGRSHSFYGRNILWNEVVTKFGNPDVEILASWDTEEEAFSHEVLLISCFRDMGYKLANLTDGGEGFSGFKRTTPVWNVGVPCREETKQKLREQKIGKSATWNLGRKHSEETKRRCGVKNIGRVHTEEEKQKRTAKLIGNKNAVGNTNRLEYKIIGTHIQTGEQIEFLGAKAVNAAGFQHSNVIKCIYGKRKSHKGYTWTREILENK
jgi:hypothetical protein